MNMFIILEIRCRSWFGLSGWFLVGFGYWFSFWKVGVFFGYGYEFLGKGLVVVFL